MAIKVNLTSKEAVKISRANRLIDRMKLGGGIVLGVFVLIIAVVYGAFFFINSRVDAVDNRVDSVVAEIQQKSETELLYRRLADMAQEAGSLIQTRKDFAGVLLDVYDLLPSDVLIEGVRFDEKAVIVDVRSQGVQSMGRAVGILALVGQRSESRFDAVALSSVRRSDDGVYTLRVELGLTSGI